MPLPKLVRCKRAEKFHTLRFFILGWAQNSHLVEVVGDVILAHAGKFHAENFLYHLRGGLINDQFILIFRILR